MRLILYFTVVGLLTSLTGCSAVWQTSSDEDQLLDDYSRGMLGSSRSSSNAQGSRAGITFMENGHDRPKIVLRDTADVRRFLYQYTSTDRKFVFEALPRRTRYLPVIEEAFRSENLPIELSNIAFVESRFIPTARSGQGAMGIWQLMKPTARRFGLTVSLFKDERQNVFRSSDAAAKYLSILYNHFEDWLLAVAAYNWGPLNIDEAIKKGDTRDFYALAEQGLICKQTREFVSKYIALTLITRNLEVFGFNDAEAEEVRQIDESK